MEYALIDNCKALNSVKNSVDEFIHIPLCL